MAGELQFVQYEMDGHIATITLNRPERLNAVGSELADDLIAAWDVAIHDDDVRVILLTGAGRIFCAGRDIKEQAALGGHTTGARGRNTSPYTTKPVVCAVRGGAWGAGWALAYNSDIVVAADDAVFAMSEVPTGTIGPTNFGVINNIPWLAASEILIRGHQISAQRCYEIGLANHVVPSDRVMQVAREIAEEIAALPPRHVQVTKEQLLMARPRLSQYQSAVGLKQAQDYLYALEDTKEAADAFAEKRTPVYRGR
ncbi:MAG: enoyl-CoA hydratase-related protein [Chloroflexi bacterium]|nr:enoyl-CoA hydratase-related protein [Chloroflexota bacterium]